MFRAALAATALALSVPAVAMEVLQLTKGPNVRWAVGERSQPVVTGDGRLGVVLTVQKSPNAGQAYYVVSFETKTGQPVNFSARVSDRPMQRTHFAAGPSRRALTSGRAPARRARHGVRDVQGVEVASGPAGGAYFVGPLGLVLSHGHALAAQRRPAQRAGSRRRRWCRKSPPARSAPRSRSRRSRARSPRPSFAIAPTRSAGRSPTLRPALMYTRTIVGTAVRLSACCPRPRACRSVRAPVPRRACRAVPCRHSRTVPARGWSLARSLRPRLLARQVDRRMCSSSCAASACSALCASFTAAAATSIGSNSLAQRVGDDAVAVELAFLGAPRAARRASCRGGARARPSASAPSRRRSSAWSAARCCAAGDARAARPA